MNHRSILAALPPSPLPNEGDVPWHDSEPHDGDLRWTGMISDLSSSLPSLCYLQVYIFLLSDGPGVFEDDYDTEEDDDNDDEDEAIGSSNWS